MYQCMFIPVLMLVLAGMQIIAMIPPSIQEKAERRRQYYESRFQQQHSWMEKQGEDHQARVYALHAQLEQQVSACIRLPALAGIQTSATVPMQDAAARYALGQQGDINRRLRGQVDAQQESLGQQDDVNRRLQARVGAQHERLELQGSVIQRLQGQVDTLQESLERQGAVNRRLQAQMDALQARMGQL